ncbi:DUF393 domain-containing protein [Sphaerothrix gracilis]|uniref:thiol-disulfide oxidoreductase DCC family protein n=1 Tax=Sphaerothrix gracilis TaxID=3151835 RepID=UPI0031FE2A01
MISPQTPRKTTLAENPANPHWQIKLLYDGDCPLCLREVNFLQKRDAGRGLVKFVDIADEAYSPDENAGIDYETAMGRIHAVLPDGTVIKNVAVFRRVYQILGMGWIYAVTKWPIIGPIVDKLYELWADWRLQLTGRPNLQTLVAERQRQEACDTGDRCKLETN